MNIKIGFFEFFSALIPGLLMFVLIVFSYNLRPISLEDVYISINHMNYIHFVLILIISYLLGFASQYPAYELFKVTLKKNKKIWDKRIGNYPISIGKRGEEISLIRENNPNNFKTLNIFLALRTMCYNLYFTLLILFVGNLVLMIITKQFSSSSFFVLILSLIISIIYLRRAVGFHQWCHNLITDCKKKMTRY